MTALVWDQVGDRIFETGVDRGVLYLPDRSGIVWNGLRSVVESTSSRTLTPLYLDGRKYSDSQLMGDFNGTLTAYTYPDEFLEFEGTVEDYDGVFLKQQPLKRFHLSYRTTIGNDVDGKEHGYKIHILYNLLAIPKDMTFSTMGDTVSAMEFGWAISAVPEIIEGYWPTAHLILDSRRIDPDKLRDLEELMYGGETTPPYLPTLIEIRDFFDDWVGITITDHGDGTWSAEGSDYYLHRFAEKRFEIIKANATYLDSDTYTVSTGTDD